MPETDSQRSVVRKLIDTLYVEAMVLTDEARAYFDEFSKADRSLLEPVERVSFSCESLKVTTRLMHIIAWLLAKRSADSDDEESQFLLPIHVPLRLGSRVESDVAMIGRLPVPAQQIILNSMDLFDRVNRLERDMQKPMPDSSPARQLLHRLESALG